MSLLCKLAIIDRSFGQTITRRGGRCLVPAVPDEVSHMCCKSVPQRCKELTLNLSSSAASGALSSLHGQYQNTLANIHGANTVP